MVDQPQPPKSEPPAPPKTAAKPAPHSSPSKKKGAEILMGAVIVVFVLAGLMMIPAVRGAVFGSSGDVDVSALAIPGKPIIDKPRSDTPMGEYTQYFGARKSFVIEDNNVQRTQYYYLVKPQKAEPGAKYPLVIFLHDEKGQADGAVQLLSQRAKLPPFYLLVPQAPAKKTWAVPDKFSGQEFGKSKTAALWTPKKYPEGSQTLKDVLILVSRLLPTLQIDDERLYAVGCGEGGIGVYGALAKFSDFFAGGLVASGLWSFNDAPKMLRTPLIIFHGTKDKQTDVIAAQGMSQVLKQLGGVVSYNELTDLDRNCADPRQYTAGIMNWLFGQRRIVIRQKAQPEDDGLQPAGYMGEVAPPSPVPAVPPTKP